MDQGLRLRQFPQDISSYFPSLTYPSSSLIVFATLLRGTESRESQVYNILRIWSILGLKCGLGVSICLIRSSILAETFPLPYFILALTMLSFPSSWKGWKRQLRTNSTQPNIHMSTLSSTGYLRYRSIISGGLYIRVVCFQNRSSQWQIFDFGTVQRSIFSVLQLPKSHSLATPLERRMFSTFRSWWITPRSCISFTPFTVSLKIFMISFSVSARLVFSAAAMKSQTVFSANSIRMYASRYPSLSISWLPWYPMMCLHEDSFFMISTQ